MFKKIKFIYSIAVLVFNSYIIFLLYRYNNIPKNIPIHKLGNSISYGNKLYLFLPILINAIFLLLAWFVIKNPKKMIKLSNMADDKAYEKMQFIIVLIVTLATIIYTYLLFSDVIYN